MRRFFGTRTYKTNMKLKIALLVFAAVAVLCIAIMIFIFFYFQKYIVYTADGLYLDVPWLN